MDFNIIPATMEDDQKMYDFLMEQYYPDEPVNVASKRTLPVDKEHCGPVQMLKYNMSILAVKKDDPTFICGFMIIKEVKKDENDDARAKLMADNRGTGYERMLKFLDFCENRLHESMGDYWEKHKVDSVMDLTIIGVHRDFRKRGLGAKLMERSLELAKERGYRLATIQCTSAYSASLAIRYGFTEVFTLPFSDYKNEKGDIIFNTETPHTHFHGLVREIL